MFNAPTPPAAKPHAEFLVAVRGIPEHHVWAALNLQTPGTDWSLRGKGDLAAQYEQAMANPHAIWRRLKSVDLNKLSRTAHARYAGFTDWKNA